MKTRVYSVNVGSKNPVVLDFEGDVIDIGQTGLGPESAFSFGLQPEQYEIIKNGFYVKY